MARKEDISDSIFFLFTDLRPAFHWNLKQLFVFVLAEYESEENVRVILHVLSSALLNNHLCFFSWLQPLNQVIVWDRIVKSPKEALIKESNEFVKYALIGQGNELR